MKILLIIIVSIVFFALTYLASEDKKLTKATVCGGLTAVLGFVAPYIVDFVGNSDNTSGGIFLNHVHQSASNEKENIIDATCIGAGSYELVSYCKCGKELDRETFAIEPLGHNYVDAITEPSCKETGFITYTCSRCKDSYVDNYIDALGHNYIDTITEPSCEEAGFTTYTCNRCKDSYVGEQTDALGHDFVEEICSRCGTVSSEYEPLILSRANELVDSGKYDEAFNVVSEALDIVRSDSLQQLLSSIQGMQEKDSKYTAKSVEFITYNGSINSSDQIDSYSLVAPVTGYYRFDVSDMINGFYISLYVYDSTEAKVEGGSRLGNGDGVTCELIQGNSYIIKIMSYSNTGNYTLTIGQQKEIIDISEKEIIYDGIEYKDQQNEYTFIPSIDGTYRFDFSEVINDFYLSCYIYDSLGYKVEGSSRLGNGAGVTAKLLSDEKYTIKVIQYSNVGTYTLTIGKQQVIQDITGENFISGYITYKDQENIYIYTPHSTGEYTLSLQNMVSGFYVTLYVYDSLDYKVGGSSRLGNENKISVKLTEGNTYTIYLIQYSDAGSYDINISYING